jgi:hypothetical protein
LVQAATGSRPGYNFDGRITPVAPDIRFDPDYAEFWKQERENGQVLPAPIPEVSLYPDLERRRQNSAAHQFPNGAGVPILGTREVVNVAGMTVAVQNHFPALPLPGAVIWCL